MTCRNCRHEFCWICMQPWSLHSQRTGGFFQCNRFVENEDETSYRRISNDQGNAHVEAIRQRETAVRIARYIHHYTRFKAHGESVVLEARMANEAVVRLRDILARSIHVEDGDILFNEDDYVAKQTSYYLNSPSKPGQEITLKWLLVDSSFIPYEDLDTCVYPTPLTAVRNRLMRSERVEMVALEFLHLGFEELIKCRHVCPLDDYWK